MQALNRRSFLKLGLLVLPGLSGCAAPSVYDKAKYGEIRRIGIVAYPQRFDAEISMDGNMYSAAGEDGAAQRQLSAALGSKCTDFEFEMRKNLAATLNARGIQTSEIAYRDSGSFLNPILRTPNYKGAGEPLYLECQISLCFARLRDGIAPGAGTFNRLVTEDGDTLWGSRISIGPSGFRGTQFIGMPTQRFKDVTEITKLSNEVSAFLMSFASPLGRSVGELLVRDTRG